LRLLRFNTVLNVAGTIARASGASCAAAWRNTVAVFAHFGWASDIQIEIEQSTGVTRASSSVVSEHLIGNIPHLCSSRFLADKYNNSDGECLARLPISAGCES